MTAQKDFFRNNSKINNCRWIAWLEAMKLIFDKADKEGIPEKVVLNVNPRQISEHYIEPIAAELNAATTDDRDDFYFI